MGTRVLQRILQGHELQNRWYSVCGNSIYNCLSTVVKLTVNDEQQYEIASRVFDVLPMLYNAVHMLPGHMSVETSTARKPVTRKT